MPAIENSSQRGRCTLSGVIHAIEEVQSHLDDPPNDGHVASRNEVKSTTVRFADAEVEGVESVAVEVKRGPVQHADVEVDARCRVGQGVDEHRPSGHKVPKQ